MKRLLFVFLPVALISGCSSSKKAAKTIPDRYTTLIGYQEESDDLALTKIATEIAPVPAAPNAPKAKRTLFDFTPKGQAEIEDLTAKKDPKIDSALEALANKTFQDTKQDENIVDLTSQERQITFDVYEPIGALVNRTLSPADRIEELDLTVTLDDAAFREEKFDGWSQLTTKYGQYNIGGISFGRTSSATLNPSVTIGTVTASVGSLSKTDSFQQGDSLIQQYVSLSGHRSDRDFVLEMNSVPSTTLLGRTSLTISMKSKGIVPKYIYAFSNLFDDKAKPTIPEKVTVKSTSYLLPQLEEEHLDATLTCVYRIRHVESGAETYFEGDDAIKYYFGHFTQRLTGLIVRDEVWPKAWVIRRGDDPVLANNPIVKIENMLTRETPELTFIHYMDAILFMRWLQHLAKPTFPADGIPIGEYSIQIPAHGDFKLDVVPL
jgi:hypothetical protein